MSTKPSIEMDLPVMSALQASSKNVTSLGKRLHSANQLINKQGSLLFTAKVNVNYQLDEFLRRAEASSSSLKRKSRRIDVTEVSDDEAPNSDPIHNRSNNGYMQSNISSTNSNFSEIENIRSPREIQKRIPMILYKWGPIISIPPDKFFLNLLSCRGYESLLFPSNNSSYKT